MQLPKVLLYSIKLKKAPYSVVGLDLSAKHCGLAYFQAYKDRVELINLKSVERNKGCTDLGYSDDIVNEVLQIKPDTVIGEDVFLKKFGNKFNVTEYNRILRIQGNIEYGLFPDIPLAYIGASHARKVINVNSQANKAEIQAYIYELLENKTLPIFKQVQQLRADYNSKKLKINAYHYQANKLSEEIYKQTQLNEHKSDAVVIVLAHLLEVK
jgi:hypothetical protein